MCNDGSMTRRHFTVRLDAELVLRLDRLAASEGTSRSELLRRGAVAVLEADELLADDELIASYRLRPQDPLLVEAATRLAGEVAPKW
jgi:hypothetical protein